jgi:glycosyltransferase involved in cell wall biosynthesis
VPKGIDVVDLKARNYLSTLIELTKYIRRDNPDILVSAFPHFNVICLLARKLSGAKTKVIITEHTPLFLLRVTAKNLFNKLVTIFILPYLVRVTYPRADAVVCVSNGVAKDLLKIVYLNNLKVIYNPIVDEELTQLSSEKIDHKWLLNSDIPVVVAVGRLAKAKDYPTLLNAIDIVLKKQAVRLIILGEGPEESKLKKMAESLGLSQNVDFLGFCKNPYKYIRNSSVYVLSSIQEGFGNTIVEAMACSKPVIATDCPSGPAEIIENGKTGVLVPVSNPGALASAVLKVINEHSFTEKLSEAGFARAQYFSSERSVGEYTKVFKEVTYHE